MSSDLDAHSDHDDPLLSIVDSDAHSNHDDPLLSIVDSDTHSNHDDPLLSIVNLEDRSSTRRSTPESHWGCPGGFGYGQGAPVFSCGCYRHNVAEGFELGPSPGAEQLGYEQPEPVCVYGL
jgi:hypothetical protein